jgi:hypothetical protein
MAQFGWKFTVAEKYITRLSEGCIPPMDCTCIHDNVKINYWYKNIDQVIEQRIALEHDSRPDSML